MAASVHRTQSAQRFFVQRKKGKRHQSGQKTQLSLGSADCTAYIRRPAFDSWPLEKTISQSDYTVSYTLWWRCYIERYKERWDTMR